MAKKKDREWKGGKGIKGTVRAAITHHPDKFDADCKDPNRLCPYAIFTAMKKKGFESHYKDQKSTLKGKPRKKAKFKGEGDCYSFKDYVAFREEDERKSLEKIAAQSPQFEPGTK